MDQLPWVEKYRPQNVDEIAYQEEAVQALKSSIEQNNLPHLLFYGPPGTGKTSAILAACRQMFGNPSTPQYKQKVLELNASDERGISVIREKVKKFAQIQSGSGFKVIILDEADQMTNEAQSALRRVIENYTKLTRFCLICNYISKIIDPIISRCVCFRFKPIPVEAHIKRLQIVCQQENCNATTEAFKQLVELSQGDLRRSLTTLQSCAQLFEKFITEEGVKEVGGLVPQEHLEQCIRVCRTRNFREIQTFVNDFLCTGFSIQQFMQQFSSYVIASNTPDIKKSKICQELAEMDGFLTQGACEKLQFINFLGKISEIVIA